MRTGHEYSPVSNLEHSLPTETENVISVLGYSPVNKEHLVPSEAENVSPDIRSRHRACPNEMTMTINTERVTECEDRRER